MTKHTEFSCILRDKQGAIEVMRNLKTPCVNYDNARSQALDMLNINIKRQYGMSGANIELLTIK